MDQKSNRQELERRLEQARRMLKAASDRVTTERLATLVRELEQQLH